VGLRARADGDGEPLCSPSRAEGDSAVRPSPACWPSRARDRRRGRGGRTAARESCGPRSHRRPGRGGRLRRRAGVARRTRVTQPSSSSSASSSGTSTSSHQFCAGESWWDTCSAGVARAQSSTARRLRRVAWTKPRRSTMCAALPREPTPQAGHDHFRVERVEAMSLDAGSMDVVLSSAVLHFARDDAHWWAMVRGCGGCSRLAGCCSRDRRRRSAVGARPWRATVHHARWGRALSRRSRMLETPPRGSAGCWTRSKYGGTRAAHDGDVGGTEGRLKRLLRLHRRLLPRARSPRPPADMRRST
jgi:hypothetical protein